MNSADSAFLIGIGYVALAAFWAGRLSVAPPSPAFTPEHNVGAVVVEVAASVLAKAKFVGPDWTVSQKLTVKPSGKDSVWLLVTTQEPLA